MLDGDALRGDTLLFRAGNTTCWTHKFLRCMGQLGLLDGRSLASVQSSAMEDILDMRFDDVSIRSACLDRYNSVWNIVSEDSCPRDAASKGALRHKYFSWFHRKSYLGQPHLQFAFQQIAYKTMMRFRLNSWKLHCYDHHIANRRHRICLKCNQRQIEDEKHVVFECPRYRNLRSDFQHLFTNNNGNMQAFMNQENQYALMVFLSKIHKDRFD